MVFSPASLRPLACALLLLGAGGVASEAAGDDSVLTVEDNLRELGRAVERLVAEEARPHDQRDERAARAFRRRGREGAERLREWRQSGKDALGMPLSSAQKDAIDGALRATYQPHARRLGLTREERIRLRVDLFGETAAAAARETDRDDGATARAAAHAAAAAPKELDYLRLNVQAFFATTAPAGGALLLRVYEDLGSRSAEFDRLTIGLPSPVGAPR